MRARRKSPTGRRKPSPWASVLLTPHTFVLGLIASVSGLAGAIRGVMTDAGAPQTMVLAGIGILGILLTVVCVVEYGKR